MPFHFPIASLICLSVLFNFYALSLSLCALMHRVFLGASICWGFLRGASLSSWPAFGSASWCLLFLFLLGFASCFAVAISCKYIDSLHRKSQKPVKTQTNASFCCSWAVFLPWRPSCILASNDTATIGLDFMGQAEVPGFTNVLEPHNLCSLVQVAYSKSKKLWSVNRIIHSTHSNGKVVRYRGFWTLVPLQWPRELPVVLVLYSRAIITPSLYRMIKVKQSHDIRSQGSNSSCLCDFSWRHCSYISGSATAVSMVPDLTFSRNHEMIWLQGELKYKR